MTPIKLGLPKGSLQDSTFALMKKAGWNFKVGSRSYMPAVDDPDIAARLIRPQAAYFGLGRIGRDQVEEYAARKGMSVEWVERWLASSLGY